MKVLRDKEKKKKEKNFHPKSCTNLEASVLNSAPQNAQPRLFQGNSRRLLSPLSSKVRDALGQPESRDSTPCRCCQGHRRQFLPKTGEPILQNIRASQAFLNPKQPASHDAEATRQSRVLDPSQASQSAQSFCRLAEQGYPGEQ